MAMRTRFVAKGMNDKFNRSIAEVSGLREEIYESVEAVAAQARTTIRSSGFGKNGWNEKMASDFTTSVTAPSGRKFFVRMGWIKPRSDAKERGNNGNLWYQYADSGYHMFGGPRWIEGIGFMLDSQDDAKRAAEDVLQRKARRIGQILGKG